jgi:hypothetical protein
VLKSTDGQLLKETSAREVFEPLDPADIAAPGIPTTRSARQRCCASSSICTAWFRVCDVGHINSTDAGLNHLVSAARDAVHLSAYLLRPSPQ